MRDVPMRYPVAAGAVLGWLSLCLIVSLLEAGVKEDKSSEGLKVSLGDRSAQARSVYGNPDRIAKNQPRPGFRDDPRTRNEYWYYDQKGLSFFLIRNVIFEIAVTKRYRGEVEGIYIGDTAKAVQAKLGVPDNAPRDNSWTYYRKQGRQERTVRVVFGKDNTVNRISIASHFKVRRR
ncbi:MAG: hypothetical protein NTX71_01030 [Candidatus Aureabacteria bacterium]|nr:hypothetical protein [Candidatus Auribacterota bacterium]